MNTNIFTIDSYNHNAMKSNIRHFNLEITKRCNQKCFYCFNNSGHSKTKDELTLSQWKDAISDIAYLGYKSVHITGGEPFLHPNIIEILQQAVELGLSTTVLSNGFRIESLAKKNYLLFSQIKTAQISLDSTEPSTHNTRRGFRHAYEDAISAIKTFINLNVPVEISTTVSDQNINDLLDIGLFCKEIGAVLIIRSMIKTGRALNIESSDNFNKRFDSIKLELINKHKIAVVDDRFCYVADDIESDKLFLQNGIITVEATGSIRSKSIFLKKLPDLLYTLKAA